jgi:hypothetical protein
VRARPVGQRPPRLLGDGQGLPPVGRQRNLPEDTRHLRRQQTEVLVAAGRDVALVARGGDVTVGAFPVDHPGGEGDDLEARLLGRTADRHAEDDAVGDACELMRGAPDCSGRDGETASTVEKLCMTGASLVENLRPKNFSFIGSR